MRAGVRWVRWEIRHWQVDEVRNAIEWERDELQGLHGQLNALLEESKAREKEEEVREYFSLIRSRWWQHC